MTLASPLKSLLDSVSSERPLLAWLKKNEAASYGRIHRVLMAHDWIRYKFTGEFGAEITNISGSNLYNVGTGVGTSLNQIVKTIEKMTGKKISVTYHQSRSVDVRHNVLDIGKAKKTGWKPKRSLYAGIKKIYSDRT